MLRVAVLLSGRGSNLQALINASQKEAFPAKVVCAISNVPDARGLQRASDAGIKSVTIDHRGFSDRAAFDDALDAALRACEAELVCLAGFMRILTAGFVDRWRDRMINIHPSLLPAFKGLNPQQQALDAGVKLSGCTVHYVRHGMDEGPIIAQTAVPVLADDDAETLADRILVQEHALLPLIVKLIAEDRVSIENDRARIDTDESARDWLRNPSPR